MNTAWFIAARLAWPKAKTLSSFIIKLCTIGTAISIAVMILGTAVYDGFEYNITQKFYNCWGNIHIINYTEDETTFSSQSSIIYNKSLLDSIATHPQVSSACAYNLLAAVLKTKKEIDGVILKGIDAQYNWPQMLGYIKQGKPIQYITGQYSKQIMLSNYQANLLQVKVNDSLLVYFFNNGQQELPRTRKLHVCGIFETGIQENDKTFCLVDQALIQHLSNDSTGTVNGYEVHTTPGTNNEALSNILFDKYLQAPLKTYTLEQRFAKVFQWLHLVKDNLNVVYLIMLLVAVVNMISGVLILIVERTNMIGILKALGNNNAGIQQIFIYKSIIITLVGIAAGLCLSVLLYVVQMQFKIVKLDPNIYYIDHVMLKLNWYKISMIIGGTLAIFAMLITLASILVKSIKPISAIKFD
jgi:lipoprotein-releasing system permease protein